MIISKIKSIFNCIAITTVENIINKRIDKSNIWNINAEQEYHEEKNTTN